MPAEVEPSRDVSIRDFAGGAYARMVVLDPFAYIPAGWERPRPNGEIAKALWISPATVRKHLENAYAKLGVRTRTAAVRRAREHHAI